ncbi:Myb-like_DNA-binding domain-containing protein [Hexamita inflata]|uniref:Myb-like DNA-binding domain-containing protein n=1 Tax=Hexamita inflata TaxID=28002 RepID=A0AA86U9Z6_9EUKA|nr:Myb-like DNA-binding domain-containing protein [Hexamita inflata]
MCREWSEQDIKRLIEIVSVHTDYRQNKVDWVSVQRYFIYRSVQQCKSFYCNKVRQYMIISTTMSKTELKFVHSCYYYMIQKPLPAPDESLEQKIQRILAESSWSDVLNAYLSNADFKQHKKLLKAAQHLITYHFEHENEITQALKNGTLNKHGITLTIDKWNDFVAMSERYNLKNILNYVEQQLYAK